MATDVSTVTTTSSLRLLFSLIFLALFVAIPILIGIYVYRDAKRRSMNAIPWTILCILAPAFIGLIIYLIVRSDHSPLLCGSCGKPVKEQFVRCPYCGVPLKELCKTCGHPLEAGWKLCPECGAAIDPVQEAAIRTKQPKDRGIGRLLAIVILVPVLICILTIMGLSVNISTGSSSVLYTTSMSVEDIYNSNIDVEAWIAGCDAAGEGVYVLRAEGTDGESINGIRTAYLIYRNDGYRFLSMNANNGTLFSKPELEMDYEENTENKDYDLLYCTASGDKAYNLAIRSRSASDDDSEFVSTDYDMEELDSLSINSLCLTVNIDFTEDADYIYSVSCTFYAGDDSVQTDICENADQVSLADTEISFFQNSPVQDEITSFELEFYDHEGNQLLDISIDYDSDDPATTGSCYSYTVSTDEDGALTIVDDNGNYVADE